MRLQNTLGFCVASWAASRFTGQKRKSRDELGFRVGAKRRLALESRLKIRRVFGFLLSADISLIFVETGVAICRFVDHVEDRLGVSSVTDANSTAENFIDGITKNCRDTRGKAPVAIRPVCYRLCERNRFLVLHYEEPKSLARGAAPPCCRCKLPGTP